MTSSYQSTIQKTPGDFQERCDLREISEASVKYIWLGEALGCGVIQALIGTQEKKLSNYDLCGT